MWRGGRWGRGVVADGVMAWCDVMGWVVGVWWLLGEGLVLGGCQRLVDGGDCCWV